jgi:hypothetical protein
VSKNGLLRILGLGIKGVSEDITGGEGKRTDSGSDFCEFDFCNVLNTGKSDLEFDFSERSE